jgi:hypothetical protein
MREDEAGAEMESAMGAGIAMRQGEWEMGA